MNLDDRLRTLARHLDDELDVSSPDHVGGPDDVTLRRRPRGISRPRLASIAAAVVITVGAGGLAVASWSRDPAPAVGTPALSVPEAGDTTPPAEPTAAALRPRLPTAYPSVDEQIEGATAAEGSYSMLGYENPVRVEALIGVVSGAALSGGIEVQAVAGDRAAAAAQLIPTDTVDPSLASMPASTTIVTGTSGSGSAPTEPMWPSRETVEVWGREADLYTEPGSPRIQTVVVDAGIPSVAATLRFTGLDPLAVLEEAGEFVAVVPVPPLDDSGTPPFTLRFGARLPAGYQVVVEPTAVPAGAVFGYLSVNNTADVEGNLVQVSTYDPLPFFAAAGSFTAVDVGGTPGWMSDGPGHAVMWQVDDATFALVGGSATTDEAIAVANSVTFIDEASWRERYGVPEPDFPPAA